MGKLEVTIEIDADRLTGYTDEYLATLWHVAQANPAPLGDRAAGELAERIGREIIRRWLSMAGPELYRHQGHHHYWSELQKLGEWHDGVFVPDTATSSEHAAEPTADRDAAPETMCVCGHAMISHGTADQHCTMCTVNGVLGCVAFRPTPAEPTADQ